MTGYTTEEVARLLGLSPAQIRSYTRAGFLSPARAARGELRFAFQDLVLLRAEKGLMAARIPAAKIRGSLRRLKQQLPRGRALSELRITAEGHRVVARDGVVHPRHRARGPAASPRRGEGLRAGDRRRPAAGGRVLQPGAAVRAGGEEGGGSAAPVQLSQADGGGVAMNLVARRVAAYLDDLVPPRPARLAELETEARRTGFPIIGPATGHLCYLLARLSNARQIFELGSGFGYSTAWFARAVKENGGGTVHHVVWDDDLSRQARDNLAALGLADVVRFHVGEAVATLRHAEGPFDVIFNDIDKQDYPKALDVIVTKLRSRGLLLVDNMLWSGRIFERRDTSPADRKSTRLNSSHLV